MPPKKKTVVPDIPVVPPIPPPKVKAAEAELPTPIPQAKPTVVCHTVIADLWHPDQSRWIPTHPPVEVILDNWLKSQIKAGLIKVVE